MANEESIDDLVVGLLTRAATKLEHCAIAKALPASQRHSASVRTILNGLVDHRRIVRTVKGGRTYYALPQPPSPCMAVAPGPRPFVPMSAATLGSIALATTVAGRLALSNGAR